MFGQVKQIVHVEGMHCEHCASRVEKALIALEGVSGVKVDLVKKTALVKTKRPLSEEVVKKAIEEIGFTFAGIDA